MIFIKTISSRENIENLVNYTDIFVECNEENMSILSSKAWA